ncbi:MAG TPA: DJ-1/PfpI family protein [Candidatus Bilamarchaeum sp.]|nr:DJ-1/PfpI family protein [Candidatus Bilamarchaeum sp.]
MAKVLMIIAQQGFRDEELLIPKEILEREGHSVKVASITRMKASGSKGAVVQPDMAVYEANADFFDAVVVVGGPGSPALSETREVIDFVIAMGAKKKLTSAICLGPMTLAKAGILAGKNATVWPSRSAIALLRNTECNYRNEPVVVDGLVVTADGPQSAGMFGAELASMLKRR